MTTFHLVRHGSNDFLPHRLAGRLPDVHLNAQGIAEAQKAAERLRRHPIAHIFSSPMERCRETAAPLAAALNLPVTISEALNEVDFGEWKGAALNDVAADPRWKQWNAFRTGHILPDGETMVQIQARISSEMIRLKNAFPDQAIAVFSHGDPIRAAICYWLGMSLDNLLRLQVDPGSVTTIRVDDATAVVSEINAL